MNKEFVPYEVALELKELGFEHDGECPFIGLYNKKKLEIYTVPEDNIFSIAGILGEDENCLAPLYQKAFRWFRERYTICIWIERLYTKDGTAYYRTTQEYKKVATSKSNTVFVSIKKYKTYQEAELELLRKLIEKVK
jgi:hypothetical protein